MMRELSLLICLAQQAPPAPVVEPGEPAAPVVEAWPGTTAAGLDEVRALAARGEHAAARALCQRLLAPGAFARWREEALRAEGWRAGLARVAEPLADALGFGGGGPALRAEVLYAAGLAAAQGGEAAGADADFGRALGLAGSAELRLASGYQLGTNALLAAEALRAELPEIQQKNGTAPVAPPAPQIPIPPLPGGPGAAPVPEVDGLELARAAYLKARERFVERLRADWRDEPTRANVELVLKRLRELDEIERQRQEQQQKEQDPNQDPEQQQDSKDPNQKQDQQQKPDEQPPKPEDDQPPEDPKPEDQKPEEQKPEEQKPEEDPNAKPKSAPQPPSEVQLSKEEMTRLLDLLQQREEQLEKLRKELQQARRARARRDW